MRDDAAAVARPPGSPPRPRGPGWRAAALLALVVPVFWAASAAAVPLPLPRPDAPIAAGPGPGAPAPAAPLPMTVPVPVPRPEEDGPPMPPMPARPATAGGPATAVKPGVEAFGPPMPPVPAPPAAPPEPDPACAGLLTGGKVAARRAPPVSGPDGCGIAAPMTLDAVVLGDGRRVPLVPPALMRCDFAERFADWIRDDVVPATAAEGDLLGVADAAAYVCRSRNWTAGARISEHARGNAIDVLAFRFAKRTVGLKGADARDVLAPIRASACRRFSTVLGPGSDAYHETDLHLDLERRRNGFKLCQWDVP